METKHFEDYDTQNMALTLILRDSEHPHGLSVQVGAYESQTQLTVGPLGTSCYSDHLPGPHIFHRYVYTRKLAEHFGSLAYGVRFRCKLLKLTSSP